MKNIDPKKLDANTRQQLKDIDQIGPVVAESVYECFHDPKNRRLLQQLGEAGVKPTHEKKTAGAGPLSGKTVVVTGSLENFTRQQTAEAIKQAGGKTSSSVSAKTDFVLVGDDPGSKLDKARQLGVKTIDEKAFLKMLGRS